MHRKRNIQYGRRECICRVDSADGIEGKGCMSLSFLVMHAVVGMRNGLEQQVVGCTRDGSLEVEGLDVRILNRADSVSTLICC